MLFRNFLLLVFLVGFGGCLDMNVPDNLKTEINHKIGSDTINLVFDRVEKLREQIKNHVDELSEKNILRIETSAKRLQDNAKRDILEIEAQLKKDIDDFVDRIDEKYRSLARETFQLINKERAATLADVRYSIGFVDEKLENRITQISLTVMETLTRLDETADKFKPEKLRSEIIEPAFSKFDESVAKIKQHISELIDKVGCKAGGIVSSVEKSLERVVQQMLFSKANSKPCQSCKESWLSSPDEISCSCCRKSNLLGKNNKIYEITDIKLFRYNVCMLKSELDIYNDISNIVDTYASIQHWAMEVYCKSDLSRVTADELAIQKIMKKEAAQEYEHYLFWSKFD